MQFIKANKDYTLEDYSVSPPHTKTVHVVAVDENNQKISLSNPVGRTFPAGNSGIIFGLAGLSGDPAWIHDPLGGEEAFKALVTHEVGGHSLLGLHDVAPTDNIMFGREQVVPGTQLRFRSIPLYYHEDEEEQQWQKISRQ